MRVLFCIMFFSLSLIGCSSDRQVVKAERKAEKMEKQRAREAQKVYEAGLKQHLNQQTSETRNRMKENRKKSDQWLKPKRRDPFYKEWFKKRKLKKKR